MDANLKDSVIQCLEVLEAVFLAAHFEEAGVTLWCASPRSVLSAESIRALLDEVEAVAVECQGTQVGIRELSSHYMAVWFIATRESSRHEASRDYCALAFRREMIDRLASEPDQILNEHTRSAANVIFEALRQRTNLFLYFPPRVSERYWKDAGKTRDHASVLRPPWTAGTSLATVSLSFDLRRSTFCMDNADSPEDFSAWIDQLVRILTAITHSQGGVFDKFTGDGALVHFLERECKEVYGKMAVVAALECAIGMQRATARHLGELRKFLRLDSERLGGAIGLDVALAHWSSDHSNNPIVVGRGVVGACRLGDGTPPGRVRLTNIAYQKLQAAGGGVYPVQSVAFTSKEFSKDMKLTAWEIDAALIGRGPSWAWVDQVGDEMSKGLPTE